MYFTDPQSGQEERQDVSNLWLGTDRTRVRIFETETARHGVTPDVAVFAKAISNGPPMAAIIGRADVMQAAQESFISSTYWTDGVGPASALATIRKLQRIDVPGRVAAIGRRWREGLGDVAQRCRVPLVFSGHPAITTLRFDHSDAAALGTLLTVRMLGQGILAGSLWWHCLTAAESPLRILCQGVMFNIDR